MGTTQDKNEEAEFAILVLEEEAAIARKNKQNFVADQLLAKINRIRKRAQRRGGA